MYYPNYFVIFHSLQIDGILLSHVEDFKNHFFFNLEKTKA